MRFAEAVRQAEMVMRSLEQRSGTSLNFTMRMGLLHQMVVDCAQHQKSARLFSECAVPKPCATSVLDDFRTFTAARLDDEDILASNTLLNLNSRLTALELVKKHLGLWYAKVVADGPASD